MHFRKNKVIITKNEKESLKSASDTLTTENVTSGCSHSHGYLAVRPKDSPSPQECLLCLQVIDCLYHTKKIRFESS